MAGRRALLGGGGGQGNEGLCGIQKRMVKPKVFGENGQQNGQ